MQIKIHREKNFFQLVRSNFFRHRQFPEKWRINKRKIKLIFFSHFNSTFYSEKNCLILRRSFVLIKCRFFPATLKHKFKYNERNIAVTICRFFLSVSHYLKFDGRRGKKWIFFFDCFGMIFLLFESDSLQDWLFLENKGRIFFHFSGVRGRFSYIPKESKNCHFDFFLIFWNKVASEELRPKNLDSTKQFQGNHWKVKSDCRLNSNFSSVEKRKKHIEKALEEKS